jgi:hypothetical protein
MPPISDIIDSIDDQAQGSEALRRHFEAVGLLPPCAELPIPRGKLKNRTKTFLGNPLCRGVDELCIELLNARDSSMASLLLNTERLRAAGYVSGVLKGGN